MNLYIYSYSYIYIYMEEGEKGGGVHIVAGYQRLGVCRAHVAWTPLVPVRALRLLPRPSDRTGCLLSPPPPPPPRLLAAAQTPRPEGRSAPFMHGPVVPGAPGGERQPGLRCRRRRRCPAPP